jgi:hypothetical protein
MFLIDVTLAHPLPMRRLDLTFEDGLHAVVEMDSIVKNYSGIFAALLDDEFFRLAKVDPELGTVVWPNGADVCPDVLYSAASGKPIIERH